MLREPTKRPPLEVENHGAATKNIARQPGSRPKKQARAGGTARKDREEVEVLQGSLHGVARVLQAASATPGGCPFAWLPLGATPRGWPTSGSSSAPEGHEFAHQSELGFEQQNRFRKYRELKRKLSERALTQRKARAREEPSPGPPASKTDARPPGHQPRGGAQACPRLSRGQEGPT